MNNDKAFALLVVFCLWIKTNVSIAATTTPTPGFSAECERINGTHGSQTRLTSPFYPVSTTTSLTKCWTLYGNVDDIITLSITDLDIPSETKDCQRSFLEIGPKPHFLMCHQLRGAPLVYISEQHKLWIQLHMLHPRYAGRGFSLDYYIGSATGKEQCLKHEYRCKNGRCIPDEWLCNGASECGDGSDENICTGVKPIPDPGGYQCDQDVFGCVDEPSGEFRCLDNRYLCDKNQDCVSNIDETHCNDCGTLIGNSGVLASQNFPHSYPMDSICQWYIQTSKGHVIQIRFINFTLPMPYKNHKDHLDIFDGGSLDDALIGSYSSMEQPPPIIESTSNRMFVSLTSVLRPDSLRVGFNATYQKKGYCLSDQTPCSFLEDDCYQSEGRCNFYWDCPIHGGDERNCDKCSGGEFSCGASRKCYPESERCNGRSHCNNNFDEMNCTPQKCSSKNGTFLCRNKRCIYESWLCDGTNDCGDDSDEAGCSHMPSMKVITAGVIGSLICGLLLVIALGCTCKLHALRMQGHGSHGHHRYMSPLSRIQDEIWMRYSAPPPYADAMVTSRPYEEVRRELLHRLEQERARTSGGDAVAQGTGSSEGQGQGRSEVRRSSSGSSSSDVSLLSVDNADDDVRLIGRRSRTRQQRALVVVEPDVASGNVELSMSERSSAEWHRTPPRSPATRSPTPTPVSPSSAHQANKPESTNVVTGDAVTTFGDSSIPAESPSDSSTPSGDKENTSDVVPGDTASASNDCVSIDTIDDKSNKPDSMDMCDKDGSAQIPMHDYSPTDDGPKAIDSGDSPSDSLPDEMSLNSEGADIRSTTTVDTDDI